MDGMVEAMRPCYYDIRMRVILLKRVVYLQ